MKLTKIITSLFIVALVATSCKTETKSDKTTENKKEVVGIDWQKNTDGVTYAQVKEMAKAQNKKIFFSSFH